MTLTINVTPELESHLRREAAKHGLDTNDYVVTALQGSLHHSKKKKAPRLTEKESRLLLQINTGIPQETWHRYNVLIEKRRAENLTPEEQKALIEISDQIEQLNADRIKNLIELARLRHIPLRDLMKQLGIKTPAYV